MKTNEVLINNLNNKKSVEREVKFELVDCPINGDLCATILPEINALYAVSEAAHINKEYQKSAEFLQKAFDKTLLLKSPDCASCVKMFQGSIAQTMKSMEEEIQGMSVGIFHKKRNEKLHLILSNFINKMKSYTIHQTKSFAPRESRSVS